METDAEKNPFYADSDLDDRFLKNSRHSSNYLLSHRLSEKQKSLENRKLQLLEEKNRIEQRTLESSKRSLNLIYESEQMGTATAEELLRQKEQLQNVENKLDDVNQMLRVSEKHISSIKSFFSSVRNYFSKTPELPKIESKNSIKQNLNQIVQESKITSSKEFNSRHPALVFRDIEAGKEQLKHSKSLDTTLDSHLDEMCSGLGRLKNLAIGLGDEISEQNQMLDRITDKTDKVGWRIERQNKEMNHILKK